VRNLFDGTKCISCTVHTCLRVGTVLVGLELNYNQGDKETNLKPDFCINFVQAEF
jgi:hypothetical protein